MFIQPLSFLHHARWISIRLTEQSIWSLRWGVWSSLFLSSSLLYRVNAACTRNIINTKSGVLLKPKTLWKSCLRSCTHRRFGSCPVSTCLWLHRSPTLRAAGQPVSGPRWASVARLLVACPTSLAQVGSCPWLFSRVSLLESPAKPVGEQLSRAIGCSALWISAREANRTKVKRAHTGGSWPSGTGY